MLSQKLYLPLNGKCKDRYSIPLLQQKYLARRAGLELEELRLKMKELDRLMQIGEIETQKTANKTFKIIRSFLDSSNATEVRAP